MLSGGITLPRLYFLIVAKDADAANNRKDFAGVTQRDVIAWINKDYSKMRYENMK